MKKYYWLLLSVIFLVPNFMNRDINEFLPYNKLEKFDKSLVSLNSISKLEKFTDSIASNRQIKTGSLAYAVMVDSIVSNRFYHGFSHFTLKDNWIAAVGERLTGIGLSAKVDLEDIMKHENAACSQQSMVMMELVHRKGLNYRKVGWPHHYTLETEIDGNWYFFDPNMEPTLTNEQRMEKSWKKQADSIKRYYDTSMHKNLSYPFGVKGIVASIGPINETPARNVRLFQHLTRVLSKTLWLVPLLIFLFLFSGLRKKYPTPSN
jgi:hypothetical protein